MKLYEFAILLDPTSEEKKAGKSTQIIVDITSALANDDHGIMMRASRAIPEEHVDKLDRVRVVFRAF